MLIKDGVTGDCLTTLRITRLPFYHVIQNQDLDAHKIIGEICRSTKVYEILKIKDFDKCRTDPLKVSSHPRSSTFSFSSHGKFLSDGTLKVTLVLKKINKNLKKPQSTPVVTMNFYRLEIRCIQVFGLRWISRKSYNCPHGRNRWSDLLGARCT